MNDEDARRVYESGEQFVLDGCKLGLQYAQGRRKTAEEIVVIALDLAIDSTGQVLAVILVLDLILETVVAVDETVEALYAVVIHAPVLSHARDPLVVVHLHLEEIVIDLIHPGVDHIPHDEDHHHLETAVLL
ncbi:hypothetical protein BGZ46_004565 [Entomortierella lignicola]|nr:hypothetical protein BGZ46_004565 [Entomortierella lignicola]